MQDDQPMRGATIPVRLLTQSTMARLAMKFSAQLLVELQDTFIKEAAVSTAIAPADFFHHRRGPVFATSSPDTDTSETARGTNNDRTEMAARPSEKVTGTSFRLLMV